MNIEPTELGDIIESDEKLGVVIAKAFAADGGTADAGVSWFGDGSDFDYHWLSVYGLDVYSTRRAPDRKLYCKVDKLYD